MITKIEGIGNYYGSLHLRELEGKFYMQVFCEVYQKPWKEISKELYHQLLLVNNK